MDGHHPRPARLLVALLALLVCAIAAPAVAHADDSPATRWPAGGSTLHAALTMGAEHWGMTPCSGRVSITWSGLGPGLNARSTWAGDVDPHRRGTHEVPGQPSRNTECDITLSTRTQWDWPKLCTVVIHEVGHLTGHDHVDDPHDVMYFAYMEPAPECAATPEPQETGPPAPPTPPTPPARAPTASRAPAKKASAPKRKAAAQPKRAKAKRRRR